MRPRAFVFAVSLACSALLANCWLVRPTTMSLWADLHRETALPDGEFHGYTDTRMLVLLQSLREKNNMRFLSDGSPVNAALGGIFERSFRQHFDLSAEQFACVTDIFDRYAFGDLPSAFEDSLPPPILGDPPAYMRRCFTPDIMYCCGSMLRVRRVAATCYGRDECYPCWNIVKSCLGGCGARYFFDKKVLTGQVSNRECYWHVYKAWGDNKLATHIASKSGHAIISSTYLTDVALAQATSRSAFQTQASLHNRTVRRERGGGTVKLTGSVLMECFALFAALKRRQCRGPFYWFPPPGQQVEVDLPRETSILDMRGSLGGANHWVGLHSLLDDAMHTLATEALWSKHQCDTCCQDIDVAGHSIRVSCAVADGVKSTRHRKCTVYSCQADIPDQAPYTRFCEYHRSVRGERCAITSPGCPFQKEEGRLTCSHHRPWEDRWRRWNRRGGWHVQSAARRAGDANEPGFIKYLRSMLDARYTWGYLLSTFSCGIIAGLAPLWEHEGNVEVAAALDAIWPIERHRPTLLFYDRACDRREHLQGHPDPTWAGTIHVVDRFHYLNHNEATCAEFCSPNKTDNPLLWRLDEHDNPVFRWNSSVAESSNSFIHGLGPSVTKMSRVLNRFVLATNTLVHNEILFSEKLVAKNASFAL